MLSFWSRCLLLLAVSGASALRIDGALRRPASAAASLVPFMQAAPQIAKPKTQIKHSTGYSTGDGGGQGGAGAGVEIAKPKRKAHTEEVPLWKVILLGDEEYIEDEVCPVLVAIIPDIENDRQAKEKYDEAMATGKSLLIVVAKELAEVRCSLAPSPPCPPAPSWRQRTRSWASMPSPNWPRPRPCSRRSSARPSSRAA